MINPSLTKRGLHYNVFTGIDKKLVGHLVNRQFFHLFSAEHVGFVEADGVFVLDGVCVGQVSGMQINHHDGGVWKLVLVPF